MGVLKITSDNFEKEVMQSEKPVLIDFWAAWCGPCKMVGPVIEEISGEVESFAKVGKINVDEEGDLAQKFKVMSIPTLIVIKNGQVTSTAVGVRPKQAILDMLK